VYSSYLTANMMSASPKIPANTSSSLREIRFLGRHVPRTLLEDKVCVAALVYAALR
jgi:hypothetical protein